MRIGVSMTFLAVAVCCVYGASGAAGEEVDDPTAILFSGRDIWRNGAFAYGGFLAAPSGFEQDGFLFKFMLSGGVYRYTAQSLDTDVIGAEGVTQILPGWRMKRGNVETKIFFGLDFERHKLWPDDPGNRLRGSDVGARFAFEFWTEPTPSTMVSGDLSFSTIATNNAARAAFGWRVVEDLNGGFYIGPEVQYFASDGYRHLRIGVHITGLKTEDYEWAAAGGLAQDSDGRSSPYLRLSLLRRQ
jgi:hypothetical protein